MAAGTKSSWLIGKREDRERDSETGRLIMAKGFKVVSSNLESIAITGLGKVAYFVGKRATPNIGCGPLCVFNWLEDAIAFAEVSLGAEKSSSNNPRIFSCQFEPSRHWYVWHNNRGIPVYELPLGTILADWIMLEQEILSNGQVG
jgi:hypothetical protein